MRLIASGLACVRGERELFSGVNFSLSAGQLLLLQGANGSGKSSFLRLIAGLLPAAAGTLQIDDAPPADDWPELRRHLNYIGHLDPVKSALSASENLSFWMGLGGVNLHYDRRDGISGGITGASGAEQALEALGIAGLADIPARFLSSGQRRRLNLARLAAIPRPLWLLDEPTVGLDDSASRLLIRLMESHLDGGGLIIAASHVDLGVSISIQLQVG